MSERAIEPLSETPARFPTAVVLGWTIVLGAGLPFAVVAFGQGRTDWQYQLAGLADPFLGRPAPGWSIALGAIASLAILGLGTLARWGIGRSDPDLLRSNTTSPVRARWWFALVVVWIGYGLGIGSVAAGGGSLLYQGTMRLTFGPPLETTVEVPATCRTAVGKPEVVADVRSNADGLLHLSTRNVATGERNRYPEPSGAWADLVGGPYASNAYDLPNVPERPLPFVRATDGSGGFHDEPPLSFMGSYLYRVGAVDERGLAGAASIVGTRISYGDDGATGPGTIRLMYEHVPNDPWPSQLDVTTEWSCAR